MKVSVWIGILFFISPVYACLDKEEIEIRHEAKATCLHIQNNLPFPPYTPELEKKVRGLLDRYSFDRDITHDLRKYLSTLLFNKGELLDGLQVLSAPMINCTGDDEEKTTYMSYLGKVKIEDTFLEPYLTILGNNNKKNITETVGTEAVGILMRRNAKTLFGLLKKLPNNALYEATLSIVSNIIEAHGDSRVAAAIVDELYERDKEFSPLLKLRYAYLCKVMTTRSNPHAKRRNHINKAVPLYEEVLGSTLDPNNIYQISKHYNVLGPLYFIKKNYSRAIDSFRNALLLEESEDAADKHTHRRNLAFSLILNLESQQEEYTEAIELLRTLLRNSSRFQKKDVTQLKRGYKVALQKAGGEKNFIELQEIFQKKQQKILKSYEKRGGRIRKAIETIRHIEEENIQRCKKEDKLGIKEKENSQDVFSSSSSPSSYITSYSQQEMKEEKYVAPLPSRKIKTHKPSTWVIPEEAPRVPEEVSKITIETLLGRKGKHYKTFCKFFERYEKNPLMDSKIQISMEEVDTLMTTLHQNFDPKKGKGSHKKVTLNFKEDGIDRDEQMLILSDHTYLIADQVRDIRQRFLQYGLYPDYLEDVLRQKGLLD